MRVRLMSPCVSPVRADVEQVMSVREANLDFWDRVAAEFSSWGFGGEVSFSAHADSFPHARAATGRRPKMYDSIEQDTPILPAHVVDVGMELSAAAREEALSECLAQAIEDDGPPEVGVRMRALAERLRFAPGAGRLRLYYARIMIVEFELEFDDRGAACSQQELDDLERLGILIANDVCARVETAVADALVPAIIGLGDPRAPVMRQQSAVGRTEHRKFMRGERGPVLWVTRTLFFPAVTAGSAAETTAASWFAPVSRVDWKAAFEEHGHCVEWLRYAIDEQSLAGNELSFEDVWEGLLFSQFFYALTERLEFEIFDLLGKLKDIGGRPVRDAYETLVRAREEAQLTLVHYNHLKRFLARKRFEVVNAILEGWGFESLAKNLEAAIAVCDARVKHWARRSAARSAVYTDILLFVIGSVAIIAFIVDLTIIGRTLSSDATLGLRDEGMLDMVQAYSEIPLDFILIGGVAVIVLIALWLYRRRQRDML